MSEANRVERQVSRSELKEKHGTPEQFEKAIWKAHADLFLTSAEAESAIRNYRIEYYNAED